MTLPFNSYNQLKYHGNEYVTDQTLNRGVYRLFRNDVHLDEKMSEHISDDAVHYSYENEVIEHLSSDKLVVLAAVYNSGSYSSPQDIVGNISTMTYLQKNWQRIINEQPRNLGGHSLAFRFQLSEVSTINPPEHTVVNFLDMLHFSGFYGGELIIESPAYYDASSLLQTDSTCLNQRIVLTGGQNANSIISIVNCKSSVLVRNCHFRLLGIGDALSVGSSDFTNKEATKQDDNVYCDDDNPGTDEDSITYQCKRYSTTLGKWFDLNMLTAIRVSNSPDVTIKHCFVEY